MERFKICAMLLILLAVFSLGMVIYSFVNYQIEEGTLFFMVTGLLAMILFLTYFVWNKKE